MTWDAEKELWLAFRALRAEVNRIAGDLDKVVKWCNMAETQYLEMKEANPPSQGDQDGQAPQAEIQSDGGLPVCVDCGARGWGHYSKCPRSAEQSSQSSPQQPDQA
jgi:hypothetical protein